MLLIQYCNIYCVHFSNNLLLFCTPVHLQDQKEYPLVVGDLSDTVRRHPNLTEVTVRQSCSRSLAFGVAKGVLQKVDAQRVDVMMRWITTLDCYSKPTALISPNRECIHVCAVS